MVTKSNIQTSAPIKWHGGKTYLASKIIERMPPHQHYVEAFFGGGGVFFKKPHELIEGHSEVINDMYGELIHFWKVLQSKEDFSELHRRLVFTPFCETIWEESSRIDRNDHTGRAVAFFVRYRQSRQGLGKDFATMSRSRTRRGMNEQVSSWLSAIEGLPEAHRRLSRVVIFNENALDLIKREDDPNTFFYCDPPYIKETRVTKNAYQIEMADDDHNEMLSILGNIRGKFLLSGYLNQTYLDAEMRYSWNRTDISIDNKASSKKAKPRVVECLWSNY